MGTTHFVQQRVIRILRGQFVVKSLRARRVTEPSQGICHDRLRITVQHEFDGFLGVLLRFCRVSQVGLDQRSQRQVNRGKFDIAMLAAEFNRPGKQLACF